MALIRDMWAGASVSYVTGNEVEYDGVLYEALNDIPANTSNLAPDVDTTNWKAVGVIRIQSEHSLYAAIELELNVDSERINNSIPFFVQLAHESFKTRIRAPIQRSRVVLTVDANSAVDVPEDLLQVINLRLNQDATAGDSIFGRGGTEILAANYEEFRDLQRYYRSNIGFGYQRSVPTNYEAPVYFHTDRQFLIAPNITEGTEIELWYFATIPQLGDTVRLVNQNGDPINAEGLTLAQWIAADPLMNTLLNFVQATDRVTVNWFVTAAPQMLLYGAILAAEAYLRDDPRLPMWQQKFERAELETHELLDRFREGRAHTQQLFNAYAL